MFMNNGTVLKSLLWHSIECSIKLKNLKLDTWLTLTIMREERRECWLWRVKDGIPITPISSVDWLRKKLCTETISKQILNKIQKMNMLIANLMIFTWLNKDNSTQLFINLSTTLPNMTASRITMTLLRTKYSNSNTDNLLLPMKSTKESKEEWSIDSWREQKKEIQFLNKILMIYSKLIKETTRGLKWQTTLPKHET